VLTPETIASVTCATAVVARWSSIPKPQGFTRYRGATTITPNLRELEAAAAQKRSMADDTEAIAAAARLRRKPRGGSYGRHSRDRGMLVVPVQGNNIAVPAISAAVYDVTGAGEHGDFRSHSLSSGWRISRRAAQLANAGCRRFSSQIGAVAVDGAGSIRNALSARPGWQDPDTRRPGGARPRLGVWPASASCLRTDVMTCLHAGHLSLLSQAAKLGDISCGHHSDASVRRLKGPERPLVPRRPRRGARGSSGSSTP